jgi:hypothetical protein
MNGAILLVPRMPSRLAQGQFYVCIIILMAQKNTAPNAQLNKEFTLQLLPT